MFSRIKNFPHQFFFTGVSKFNIFWRGFQLLFYEIFGKKQIVSNVNGFSMLLDLQTPGISKALFVYGTREILDTQIVQEVMRDNMDVIEVGGNIGYYTLLEANGSAGTIYVFEPDPRNKPILEKNILMNNLQDRIKLYPWAVGDKSGNQQFYLGRKSNLSSTQPRFGTTTGGQLEVKSIKLDDFKPAYAASFLRMDIEGAEDSVIRGMEKILLQGKPFAFLIELHLTLYKTLNIPFVETLRHLKDIGFICRYAISAGVIEHPLLISKGYKPIRGVQETEKGHGLYEHIKMDDLIEMMDEKKKIVRSVLLVRE